MRDAILLVGRRARPSCVRLRHRRRRTADRSRSRRRRAARGRCALRTRPRRRAACRRRRRRRARSESAPCAARRARRRARRAAWRLLAASFARLAGIARRQTPGAPSSASTSSPLSSASDGSPDCASAARAFFSALPTNVGASSSTVSASGTTSQPRGRSIAAISATLCLLPLAKASRFTRARPRARVAARR